MKNEKKKLRIGVVFKVILFTLAFFLLIITGSILYKARTNPHKVPGVFGYKPMIVLSGSMETSIYVGDLVFVKEVDAETLKVNDVIAFWNESDTITTHRIVEVVHQNGRTYFRTKGDNNNSEDANLVPVEDVEGIYISRIPKVGSYLMFIQEPIGLAVILLVILVIGLIWLYLINKRDEKKYRLETEQEKKEFEEFKKMKEQQRLEQEEDNLL